MALCQVAHRGPAADWFQSRARGQAQQSPPAAFRAHWIVGERPAAAGRLRSTARRYAGQAYSENQIPSSPQSGAPCRCKEGMDGVEYSGPPEDRYSRYSAGATTQISRAIDGPTTGPRNPLSPRYQALNPPWEASIAPDDGGSALQFPTRRFSPGQATATVLYVGAQGNWWAIFRSPLRRWTWLARLRLGKRWRRHMVRIRHTDGVHGGTDRWARTALPTCPLCGRAEV